MSGVPPAPPPGEPPKIVLRGQPVQGSQDLAAGLASAYKDRQDKVPDFKLPRKKGEFEDTDNSAHEWIIYETVFNHDQFARTPRRRGMGAYTIPLSKLQIVLHSKTTDAEMEFLRQAFFPLLTLPQLKASIFRPWVTPWREDDFQKLAGSTTAVMPYNFLSNDSTGIALGTVPQPSPASSSIVRLSSEWGMWQTASRSCVIQLAPTKTWVPAPTKEQVEEHKSQDARTPSVTTIAWPFRQDRDARVEVAPGKFEAPQGSPEPLAVKNLQGCYSIKTGVVYVGTVNQMSKSSGEKGMLEKESLFAALRSEYCAAIDDLPKRNILSKSIIILPEILTVTSKSLAPIGDGFQLRDLSRLDRSCKYFPFLSIPYLGRGTWTATPTSPTNPSTTTASKVNLDKYALRWSGLARIDSDRPDAGPGLEWSAYWTANYGAILGQAKAILHLCYGLQPLTPNAQNFLLEYSNNEPTGRVVVRDLLDMKLHSDWLSTLFGNSTTTTTMKTINYDASAFGNALTKAVLKFEAGLDGAKFETLVDVKDESGVVQYFKGTQLNWYPYTSLLRGSMVANPGNLASDTNPREPGWQRALFVNVMWGLAHALEYLQVFNNALGLGIDPITLYKLPLAFDSPQLRDRYKNVPFKSARIPGTDNFTDATVLKDTDNTTAPFLFITNAQSIIALKDDNPGWQRAGELHALFCQWERRVSQLIHERVYSAEGRARLRAFHGL